MIFIASTKKEEEFQPPHTWTQRMYVHCTCTYARCTSNRKPATSPPYQSPHPPPWTTAFLPSPPRIWRHITRRRPFQEAFDVLDRVSAKGSHRRSQVLFLWGSSAVARTNGGCNMMASLDLGLFSGLHRSFMWMNGERLSGYSFEASPNAAEGFYCFFFLNHRQRSFLLLSFKLGENSTKTDEETTSHSWSSSWKPHVDGAPPWWQFFARRPPNTSL